MFLSAVADLFQILVVNTSDRELAVLPIIQQSFLSISLLAKLLFIQLFCAEGPSESVPVIGAEWKEKRYVGKKRRAIDGVVGGWCIATAILVCSFFPFPIRIKSSDPACSLRYGVSAVWLQLLVFSQLSRSISPLKLPSYLSFSSSPSNSFSTPSFLQRL